MKKLIILFLMSFICLEGISQTQKFRLIEGAYKLLNDNGEWSEWSEWSDINSLVTFNTDTDRITIYEEPRRTFDIISYKESISETGDKLVTLECLGHNEDECIFRIVIDQNNDVQFYIAYKTGLLVYNVKVLD